MPCLPCPAHRARARATGRPAYYRACSRPRAPDGYLPVSHPTSRDHAGRHSTVVYNTCLTVRGGCSALRAFGRCLDACPVVCHVEIDRGGRRSTAHLLADDPRCPAFRRADPRLFGRVQPPLHVVRPTRNASHIWRRRPAGRCASITVRGGLCVEGARCPSLMGERG